MPSRASFKTTIQPLVPPNQKEPWESKRAQQPQSAPHDRPDMLYVANILRSIPKTPHPYTQGHPLGNHPGPVHEHMAGPWYLLSLLDRNH